ncbi:piggyBac transposable element-derived protein 4-like [Homalodisca vitripennis]|uniref:piggyBac transposable element-derived protein 4-like n=1 Tax=Homalodisca vitripennis TaxID=197043 RepID=UPI001EEC8FE5|nr:piggyBac transposable element-derived protein 4-like [Homalodisca vitripennis]
MLDEDSVIIDEDQSSITSVEDNTEYPTDYDSSAASDSEPDNPASQVQGSIVKGKNGYTWSLVPPPTTRTANINIIRIPHARGTALNITTEEDAFKILLDQSAINMIVIHTNTEIAKRREKFTSPQRYLCDTDSTEILSLIGLLYTAGSQKDGHLSTSEMWSPYGSQFYKCVMTENRFRFLLICLRFDNKDVRNTKDNFAPIRELWMNFIDKCKSVYEPHAYVTIDEQLLAFRGRCPFKVYIAKKPDKYGIKIVTMCDARTYYMIDAIPYIGKDPGKTSADYYVNNLTKTIHGTGRNIICDNWFMSVPLVEEMAKDHNLTLVGTVRRNKREIPTSFLADKQKPVNTTQFGLSGQVMLTSFTPKKNKCVLILSTMHNQPDVNKDSQKPEVIEFYNSTKGGVDTFYKMVHAYSVSRGTRRWPLRMCYGMLDQAGVNAMVLFKKTVPLENMKRRQFLKELGLQLARPHMERRLETNLSKELKATIKAILHIEDPQLPLNPPAKLAKQARCHLCPRCKDKKVKLCVQNAGNQLVVTIAKKSMMNVFKTKGKFITN